MAEAKHFAKKMQEESSRSGKAVIIRPFNSVEDFCAEYKKAIRRRIKAFAGVLLGQIPCLYAPFGANTAKHSPDLVQYQVR